MSVFAFPRLTRFRLTLAAAAIAAAMPSLPAQAFTNGWSFLDSSTRRAVHGTVSGFGNGATDAVGLTATVDVAPDTTLLGTYRGYSGGFTATGGVVTAVNAFFKTSDDSAGMFFGAPAGSTYYPQVLNYIAGTQAGNEEAADVFVSTAGSLTNRWSFVDGLTGTVVSGTLSGLREGYNEAFGLTATVTDAPYADLLGLFAGKSGGFDVANGVVVFAEAFFNGAGPSLDMFFGAGSGTAYYPQVANGDGHQAYDDVGSNRFAAGAVPEPAAWGLMILGFGLVGHALRRGRRAGRHDAA